MERFKWLAVGGHWCTAVKRSLALVALSVLLTIGTAATAEELNPLDNLIPLKEWMELPDDEQEPSYLFMRCAGLFLGIVGYYGESRKAETQTFQAAGVRLSNLALALRMQQLNKDEAAQLHQALFSQMRRVADTYVSRMRQNYLDSGSAVRADEELAGEVGLCRALAERFK